VQEADQRARFEGALLPHLGAAHNLARWLTRNDQDAQDIVQEAYMRAWKSFAGFHGEDGRSWLLAIVRNTCYTLLEKKRTRGNQVEFDEHFHGIAAGDRNPELLLARQEELQTVRGAVEELPAELREVVVLRELEGLSYKEIAALAEIPLGTVMSRLARARDRLQQCLRGSAGQES